jgi:hypothetical protein
MRTRLVVFVCALVGAVAASGGFGADAAYAYEVTLRVYGYGLVDETTDANLAYCVSPVSTPTGSLGATCAAGSPSGEYGWGWIVEYRADPPVGWEFDSWIDGGAGEVNCDDDTAENVCRFQIFANLTLGARFRDVTDPRTQVSGGPTGTVNSKSASFTFTSYDPWTSSNPTPSPAFDCRLDGVAKTCSSGGFSQGSISFSDLDEGNHVFAVRSRDPSGNWSLDATRTWAVDTTPPPPPTISGPSGTVPSTSATFNFSSGGASGYECSLNSSAFAPCSSGISYSGLGQGSHTFQVYAKDVATNESSVATRTWTVDTVAPDTLISGGPTGTTTLTSASFALGSTDGDDFQCNLDDAGYVPCESPYEPSGLSPTTHTLLVRAVDAVGNADLTPAGRTWTVVTAPETTITSGLQSGTALLVGAFGFSSNVGAATFECRVDGAPYAPCSPPASFSALRLPGAHTLDVRATENGTPDPTPARRDLRVVSPFLLDLDADTRVDRMVWRPASGGWYRPGLPATWFGRNGDVPVPGQWDADPEIDLAVWRPAVGGWYVQGSPTIYFGRSTDVPVPADWDGDGDLDPAVFRPSSGGWYVLGRATVFHGRAGDVPFPGQWDGDAAVDLAVWRPSNGRWYIQGNPSVDLGGAGDVPVPADWDGDGDLDPAVYRPTGGLWLRHGMPTTSFGTAADVPVPGQWDADPALDLAVWRPASGGWYVQGAATTFFGNSSDIV